MTVPMNFEEKIKYLEAKGWHYNPERPQGKVWLSPHDLHCYGTDSGAAIQRKIDSGEFKATTCIDCTIKIVIRPGLKADHRCLLCRVKNRHKQNERVIHNDSGSSVFLTKGQTAKIKELATNQNISFRKAVSNLLDSALASRP
jgi:hypothetical protein